MPSTSAADLTQRVRDLLAHAPREFVAAYLFGSQARGTARSDSDVDIAFWREPASRPTLDDQPYLYADELTQALGRTVDVVELNKAPPDLIHEVLRDGVLVFERDRAARVRFEVSARQRFLDMRPFVLRYRGLGSDP